LGRTILTIGVSIKLWRKEYSHRGCTDNRESSVCSISPVRQKSFYVHLLSKQFIIMKHDIENRQHVEQLINSFYDKVKQDDVIGFIFNDVAKVNWEKHLPVMYDFWEGVIFLTGQYSGNPMQVHMQLNHQVKLAKEHFERWLKLFTETVDELFEGKKAETAKEKAIGIATIMERKITSSFDITR